MKWNELESHKTYKGLTIEIGDDPKRLWDMSFEDCIFTGTPVTDLSIWECKFDVCKFRIAAGLETPFNYSDMKPEIHLHLSNCKMRLLTMQNLGNVAVAFDDCFDGIVSLDRATPNLVRILNCRNLVLSFNHCRFDKIECYMSTMRMTANNPTPCVDYYVTHSVIKQAGVISAVNLRMSEGQIDIESDQHGRVLFEHFYMEGPCKLPDHELKLRRITPEGAFTMYKRVELYNTLSHQRKTYILELRVPDNAQRTNSFGRKIRVSEAKVVALRERKSSVWLHDLDNDNDHLVSFYDPFFEYFPNQTAKPAHPFHPDLQQECASGIHGFLTVEEAEQSIF